MRSLIQGPLGEREEQLRVSDLVERGRWDLSRISFDLPSDLSERILSLPTPNSDAHEDILIPDFCDFHGFSLAKAYDAQFKAPLINLSWIWKSNMEPKLKFFFWLLWRDRLPHKALLATRKITSDACCPRCQLDPETSAHIIRDCSLSDQVWKEYLPHEAGPGDFRDWLKYNVGKEEMFRGILWADLFPYLCHEIWKDRNECSFKGTSPSPPQRIIFKALRLTIERIRALHCLPVINEREVGNSSRTPQMSANFVIHVDASFVKPLTPIGIGGVVRDNHGGWIMGFGKNCFTFDILSSELWAIHEGLLIASMYNFDHAIIFSDCKNAVTILNNSDINPDKYMSVISECRKLWKTSPGVKIDSCSRKENRVADDIAKQVRGRLHRRNVTRIFPHPPSYCMTDLVSDCKSMFNLVM